MRLLGLFGSLMNLVFALGFILGLVIVVALLVKYWLLGLVVLFCCLVAIAVMFQEGSRRGE